MKNLSLVLNVVLLIAVVVLYVLHFSRGSDTEEVTSGGAINLENPSIAYINSDSLLSNYAYFSDLETQFNEKRNKLDAEYRNRAEGLQREIANFQQTAGGMTISQAKAVEEDLRRKQQNLMMYQEQLTQQLVQEESKMNSELYTKVSDFLKDYGQNKNLQIVLTYTKGSGVLYANDSLNITDDVLAGLNEAYDKGDTDQAKSNATDTASAR